MGYKITADRKGPATRIHATKDDTVYTATFIPGDDNNARDHAIDTLIEIICGFSKSHILIALHDLETENNHELSR